MTGTGDRRPIASRDSGWAQTLARRLAKTRITPNLISQASILAAALAGAAFWASGAAGGGWRVALLLGAALFCQMRLICNLMDGLVAIEGGKKAADGPFWNEFPDRAADILILAGVGLGTGQAALGWAAAAMAVLTAYVRELGRASGLPSDVRGPMAKPHRMAVVTLAAVAATTEPLWNGWSTSLTAALWIVAVGAGITALRRAGGLIAGLKG